jgi:arylsulfatase A-like enzyme
MKAWKQLAACFLVFGGQLLWGQQGEASRSSKPNVLFIAVDDLNHWVGYTGRNPQTKTPNLDRLAAMGMSFTNAHCAAPVCNPSRTALLSGRRPGQTGVYSNGVPYAAGAGVTAGGSLVTQFKNAGYETIGMGKLWHGGLGFTEQWILQNEEPKIHPKVQDRSIGGIRFGVLKGGDEQVEDTAIAGFAEAELGKVHDRPFFLGLGFHKPHMPWNVPQKYYDMHPLESIELPPVLEGDLEDIPKAGREMAHLNSDHKKVLRSGRWKEAIQAYLAAVSYLDGQVGRVLDALERSSYRQNTVICLWGDHGWHLGEKEHWRKFALWEEATRAPLMWVVPGLTRPGTLCARPVDFMSIYPTLCELADLPKPDWISGVSIRPLLADSQASWKTPAVTTHGRNNHAIRTDRWRYIRYADGSEELYDHEADPYEWKNVASAPEQAAVKTELARWLPEENCAEPKAGKKKKKKRDD